MSDNVNTFGFNEGDDDIRGGQYEKYKGKKGEVHRCGVVYTDPKTMFAGSKIHFSSRYFLCKKGICCEKLGAPKWRVGAVLVKYNTDRQGNVKQPFSYELLPWLFSETTYNKLKNVNSEFPLASHDIKISCTNEEYQHLDLTPCSESIWQAKDTLKSQVLEEAKPIWDHIKKSLGSDLSVEEIKDLLGVGGGGPAADPTQKVDLDSVLSDL